MTSRMSADARRELVLEAATRAFARTGYAGTSTDAVAKEAGVSQPYVVRIFGTKLELFVEVFDRATRRIIDAFEHVIATQVIDPDSEEGLSPLGQAYADLVLRDRDALQLMVHGFAAATDPEIGAFARSRMTEIFQVVRSTGIDDDRARDFVAHGMLINVMLAIGAPEHVSGDPALLALTDCVFGDVADSLTEAS